MLQSCQAESGAIPLVWPPAEPIAPTITVGASTDRPVRWAASLSSQVIVSCIESAHIVREGAGGWRGSACARGQRFFGRFFGRFFHQYFRPPGSTVPGSP